MSLHYVSTTSSPPVRRFSALTSTVFAGKVFSFLLSCITNLQIILRRMCDLWFPASGNKVLLLILEKPMEALFIVPTLSSFFMAQQILLAPLIGCDVLRYRSVRLLFKSSIPLEGCESKHSNLTSGEIRTCNIIRRSFSLQW